MTLAVITFSLKVTLPTRNRNPKKLPISVTFEKELVDNVANVIG
jgi:hypothetical protein